MKEDLLSPHSALFSQGQAAHQEELSQCEFSHLDVCLMEGFSRTLTGNAEKDSNFKEALEGFSRRCRSFICEEVCCIPLRASSPHTILKDVSSLLATQES